MAGFIEVVELDKAFDGGGNMRLPV
jgi:hypothetical protein